MHSRHETSCELGVLGLGILDSPVEIMCIHFLTMCGTSAPSSVAGSCPAEVFRPYQAMLSIEGPRSISDVL